MSGSNPYATRRRTTSDDVRDAIEPVMREMMEKWNPLNSVPTPISQITDEGIREFREMNTRLERLQQTIQELNSIQETNKRLARLNQSVQGVGDVLQELLQYAARYGLHFKKPKVEGEEEKKEEEEKEAEGMILHFTTDATILTTRDPTPPIEPSSQQEPTTPI